MEGSCEACGYFPRTEVQDFRFLNLAVPQSSEKIALTSLVDSFLSESVSEEYLRCVKLLIT